MSASSSFSARRPGRAPRRRARTRALVDEQRRVPAVVEDHVRPALVPRERLLRAPPVLLERLALPGEDGDAGGGDRGGGVVLGGEDVARAPAHLGPERGERLDQHRGLDRHVERAGDARALERLRLAVLLAQRHQAGHLVLGELDLLAAELGEADVGDLVVGGRGGGRHRMGSSGVEGVCAAAAASSFECLSCSQRSQSRRGHVLGTLGARGQPVLHGAAERGSSRRRWAKAMSESPTLVRLEQLAQGAQALELGGAVEAIAGARPGRARRGRRAPRSGACAATSRWSPRPR